MILSYFILLSTVVVFAYGVSPPREPFFENSEHLQDKYDLGYVPSEFLNPHDAFTQSDALVYCTYENKSCHYNYESIRNTRYSWVLTVNDMERNITGIGKIKTKGLRSVSLVSSELNGTKCLYFSTYTNLKHINFVISVRNKEEDTETAIKSKSKVAQKVTVGLGISGLYRIAFHLYGNTGHGHPVYGVGAIGRIVLTDGPCLEEQSGLNCTFDYTLCHWIGHDVKHEWYPVPFGLHHSIAHKIEFGALAAFAGHGQLWSPLVEPIDASCFSFSYSKGATDVNYLRVWLLYRVPGVGDVKAIVYEDLSMKKIMSKKVQVNINIPWHFQVAFEGRSKNLHLGIVVYHPNITSHHCDRIDAHLASCEKLTLLKCLHFPKLHILMAAKGLSTTCLCGSCVHLALTREALYATSTLYEIHSKTKVARKSKFVGKIKPSAGSGGIFEETARPKGPANTSSSLKKPENVLTRPLDDKRVVGTNIERFTIKSRVTRFAKKSIIKRFTKRSRTFRRRFSIRRSGGNFNRQF